MNERLVNLNNSSDIKFHLFQTEYYDIESYFINSEHINALYPNFSIEEIEQKINESTKEAKDKSLDKLFNKIAVYQKEAENKGEAYKFSYPKTIKKLNEQYEANPKRYRYGKTVLGILIGKLQNGFGNIDLLQKTDKITIPQLKKIVEE